MTYYGGQGRAEERDPMGMNTGTDDPWLLSEAPVFKDIVGEQPMIEAGGNSMDPRGGCEIDGVGWDCNDLARRAEGGSVVGAVSYRGRYVGQVSLMGGMSGTITFSFERTSDTAVGPAIDEEGNVQHGPQDNSNTAQNYTHVVTVGFRILMPTIAGTRFRPPRVYGKRGSGIERLTSAEQNETPLHCLPDVIAAMNEQWASPGVALGMGATEAGFTIEGRENRVNKKGFTNETGKLTMAITTETRALFHSHANKRDPKPSLEDPDIAEGNPSTRPKGLVKHKFPVYTFTSQGLFIYDPFEPDKGKKIKKLRDGLEWRKPCPESAE